MTQRTKPRSGAVPMAHAYKVLTEVMGVPPAAIHKATKTTTWIVKGSRRIPISRREDLWGVFDYCVLGRLGNFAGIQVTTEIEGRQTVTSRKKKIETWMQEADVGQAAILFGSFEIWAWVDRKHFRRWIWKTGGWEEIETITPLKPRKKRCKAKSGNSAAN
jgi:hypothetical protein